jgi:hypothetical protein
VSIEAKTGRMTALAGFRRTQFVGYAIRGAEGWICVVSLGFNWTTSSCRTADEARNILRTTAQAVDLKWLAGTSELMAIISKLPEHMAPSILPESLGIECGRLPSIGPAIVSVWQKK